VSDYERGLDEDGEGLPFTLEFVVCVLSELNVLELFLNTSENKSRQASSAAGVWVSFYSQCLRISCVIVA